MKTRASWALRITAAVVAAGIVSAGCSVREPSPPPTTRATEATADAGNAGTNSVKCDSLLDAAPDEAGRALEEAGYAISWRLVQTKSDGTTSADVETSPPPGRIVDIILEGDQAVVFVAAEEDPAAASPGPLTC